MFGTRIAANPMENDKIDPRVAVVGFATLAVLLAGEMLLIAGAIRHDEPLSPLAQMVSRAFFGH
jgi:hypothetical protein